MFGRGILVVLQAATIILVASAESLNCHFGENFCYWNQVETGEGYMTRLSGWARVSSHAPIADHSSNSPLGHYIYAGPNDDAQIKSPAIEVEKESCLVFFYYMEPGSRNKVTVYTITDNDKLSTPFWTEAKSTRNTWTEARVKIPPGKSVEVIIRATFSISIDDIDYYPNTLCSKEPLAKTDRGPIDWDFDDGTLGPWQQSSYDDFDWSFSSKNTKATDDSTSDGRKTSPAPSGDHSTSEGSKASPVPSGDHSTSDGSGKYLYIDVDGSSAGNKARIYSNAVSGGKPRCLKFWYHMSQKSIGTLDVYTVTWTSQSANLWSKSQGNGNVWQYAQVDINVSEDFEVIFEFVKGDGTDGHVALDDISMEEGSCKQDTSQALSIPFKCDLESGQCGFEQDRKDDFDWSFNHGSTKTSWTGPKADHTLHTAAGHYFYAEASGNVRREGENARLVSPVFAAASTDVCLEFYYHMYGFTMGALNVKARSSGISDATLWTMEGNLGNKWHKAAVTLNAPLVESEFQFVFEAIRGSSYFSDIAIDDVTVRTGSCKSPASCNFDQGTCSFKQSESDDFDWLRKSGSTDSSMTGPSDDHTHGNSDGSYLYLETSFPRVLDERAVLESESLSATEKGCLTFWYHMAGAGIRTLNIKLGTNPNSSQVIWSLSGPQQNAWLFGQVPVQYKESDFFIYIEGIRGLNYTGDIAIDDVAFHNVKCKMQPPEAKPVVSSDPLSGIQGPSCDFEKDVCGYRLYYNYGFYWSRSTVHGTHVGGGPVTDHTLGTDQGHYMYVRDNEDYNDSPANMGLEIRDVESDTSGLCLEFWYHMDGNEKDALYIVVRNSQELYSLWRKEGHQGDTWRRALVRIPHFNDNKFELFFHAEITRRDNVDVAIDDVLLRKGSCYGDEEVGECNFAIDFCTWTQSESGDMDWLLGHGSTRTHGTGPSSEGNRNGYIYIETSSPIPVGASAILMSQLFSPQDASCFYFFYNMRGASTGTLRVWLATYSTSADSSSMSNKQLLWELSGNQGPEWEEGRVIVPKQTQRFRILMEGVKGLSDNGDIALDYFVFTAVGKDSCTTMPSVAVPKTAPDGT